MTRDINVSVFTFEVTRQENRSQEISKAEVFLCKKSRQSQMTNELLDGRNTHTSYKLFEGRSQRGQQDYEEV